MKLPFSKRSEGNITLSVKVNPDGRRDIPKTAPVDVALENDGGVIRIGKKKYAVDLSRERETEGSVKEQARNVMPVGRAETWDLYAKVPVHQVAFGSSGIGHKKGYIPLAESIRRDLLGDSWIVIIELGDGRHWIAKKDNGQVTADEVFLDAKQARNQVISEYATPDRPVVAPASWEIPGATEASIWDLIGEKAPPLRRLGFISNNRGRILLLLLALLVTGGMYYQFKVRGEQRLLEEQRMAEQRRERVVVVEDQYPWFEAPTPTAVLNACARLFNESIRVVPGWTTQVPVCQHASGQVVLTQGFLRQDEGRISWLRHVYDGEEGSVSLDNAGNIATYSRSEPLIGDAKAFRSIRPWTGENVNRILLERFQNLGLTTKVTANVARTPDSGPEKMVFNSHALSIDTPTYPTEIIRMMSDVPATMVESIIWDPDKSSWTLSLRVYHKAIPPPGAVLPTGETDA